jgi:hypothetical protein
LTSRPRSPQFILPPGVPPPFSGQHTIIIHICHISLSYSLCGSRTPCESFLTNYSLYLSFTHCVEAELLVSRSQQINPCISHLSFCYFSYVTFASHLCHMPPFLTRTCSARQVKRIRVQISVKISHRVKRIKVQISVKISHRVKRIKVQISVKISHRVKRIVLAQIDSYIANCY